MQENVSNECCFQDSDVIVSSRKDLWLNAAYIFYMENIFVVSCFGVYLRQATLKKREEKTYIVGNAAILIIHFTR